MELQAVTHHRQFPYARALSLCSAFHLFLLVFRLSIEEMLLFLRIRNTGSLTHRSGRSQKKIRRFLLCEQNRPNYWLCIALLFCFSSALSACGGGGSAKTGILVDGAVAGVQYSSASYSGVTTGIGAFQYASGEITTFSLGGTILGRAEGGARLSLFDIAGVDIPVGTRAVYNGINTQQGSVPLPVLHPVVNRAIFLQTLDEDGNPDNGLVISPGVAELVAGITLNFNQLTSRFVHSPALRSVLNRANAQALFSDHRVLRNASTAMAHVYQTLGIDAQIYSTTRYSSDSDADGAVDYMTRREFDANGRVIRYEEDANRDGVLDQFTTMTYDENSNVIREETSSLADGVIRSTVFRRFDLEGDLTHLERDENADGSFDSLEILETDLNGNVIRREEDSDGDGVVDRLFIYLYDASGNLINEQQDSIGDGFIDRIYLFQYDVSGNLIHLEFDSDANGVINSTVSYQYNANGNQVQVVQDLDGDGNPDEIRSNEYNSDGQPIRSARDTDADSTEDSVFSFEYDVNRNLIRLLSDTDADGSLDSITSHQYDIRGNRISTESDTDADGVPDATISYQYDANDNRIRVEKDDNNDGVTDSLSTSDFVKTSWESVVIY